jgi:hypothetical protein
MLSYAAQKNQLKEKIKQLETAKGHCAQMRLYNETLDASLSNLASVFETNILLTGQHQLSTAIKKLNNGINPGIDAVIALCDLQISELNVLINHYNMLEQQSAASD